MVISIEKSSSINDKQISNGPLSIQKSNLSI